MKGLQKKQKAVWIHVKQFSKKISMKKTAFKQAQKAPVDAVRKTQNM